MTNEEFSKKADSINKGFLSALFGNKRLQQSSSTIFALAGATIYGKISGSLGYTPLAEKLGVAGPVANDFIHGAVALGLVYSAMLIHERFSKANIQVNEIEEIKRKAASKPEKLSKIDAKALFDENKVEISTFTSKLWNDGLFAIENKALIEKGVGLVKRMAVHGDSDAQFHLGRMHLSGTCVEQDYKQARQLFERSAAQGNASSYFALAELYLDGDGVKQDNSKGLLLLETASEKGSADAVHRMGYIYESESLEYLTERISVQDRLGRAERCYERAANLGSVEASMRLDELRDSLIIDGYDSLSVDVLESKARAGDVRSSFDLGSMYFFGVQADKNDAAAVEHLEYAVEHGNHDAMSLLGQMYLFGNGVPFDTVRGQLLIDQSASLGNQNSISLINAQDGLNDNNALAREADILDELAAGYDDMHGAVDIFSLKKLKEMALGIEPPAASPFESFYQSQGYSAGAYESLRSRDTQAQQSSAKKYSMGLK